MFNLALLRFQVFVIQGSGCEGTVNFLQVSLGTPYHSILSCRKNVACLFHGECIYILKQHIGCSAHKTRRREGN